MVVAKVCLNKYKGKYAVTYMYQSVMLKKIIAIMRNKSTINMLQLMFIIYDSSFFLKANICVYYNIYNTCFAVLAISKDYNMCR